MTDTISNSEIPQGFVELISTSTIFAMDLIGKNLQMNGVVVYCNYPDAVDDENKSAQLFVKSGEQEQAISILTSLDLLDFTTQYGK